VGIKVEGILSDELKNLKQQEATLRKSAIDGVIDYYSAHDGQAGDAQRKKADKLVQDVWRKEKAIAKRIAAIDGLKAAAMNSKSDLSRWLKMI